MTEIEKRQCGMSSLSQIELLLPILVSVIWQS